MKTSPVAAVLGVALLATLTAPVSAADGRKYALLVGVSTYYQQLRELRFAERDIESLREVLIPHGFSERQITTLVTGVSGKDKPTVRVIRNELRTLLASVRPDDQVVIAFAGHGVQFQGDKDAFFCPYDADLNDRTSLVSLREVYDELDRCRAGTKLLLVDACRNDPVLENSRDIQRQRVRNNTEPPEDVPPGVVAMYSCSAGEKAYEDPALGRGVFFHHVVRYLQDERLNSGEVTFEGLRRYVEDEVPLYVRTKWKTTQRPFVRIPEGLGRMSWLRLRGQETARPGQLAASMLLRGQKYRAQKDAKQAVEVLNEAVKLDPDTTNALYERALAYLDRAKELADTDTEASTKYYDKADVDLVTLIRKGTDKEAEVYYRRALIAYTQEKYDRALALCSISLDTKKSVEAYNLHGAIYYAQEKYPEASKEYAKAMEMNPGYAKAYFNRGKLRYEFEKYDTAKADLLKATVLDPNNPTYLDYLVRVETAAGAVDEARIKHYEERGKKIDSYYSDPSVQTAQVVVATAYYGQGQYYYNQGQYQQAAQYYDRAVTRLEPVAPRYQNRLADYSYQRGLAYRGAGDWNMAQQSFNRAGILNPQYRDAPRLGNGGDWGGRWNGDRVTSGGIGQQNGGRILGGQPNGGLIGGRQQGVGIGQQIGGIIGAAIGGRQQGGMSGGFGGGRIGGGTSGGNSGGRR